MQEKLCPKCGQMLPFDQFHKHKGKGKFGLKSWCKVCDNAKMKELRATDPEWRENRNSATSRYYYENAEERRRKSREYEAKPEAKEKTKCRAYRRKYGITWEEVKLIIESQDNKCVICKSVFVTSRDPKLDHCHVTGKIRGVLCHPCNVSLGLMKENVENILALAEYLKRHQE